MNPLLVGGLLDIGKTLIGKLIRDPEQKAKAEMELLTMQMNGELKQLEISMSAIVAEANSSDKWTSRARPSFLYVFYFIILGLVVVAPLVGIFYPEQMKQFFDNVKAGFEAIPEELWWVFATGYLGYASARTYEKQKMISRR